MMNKLHFILLFAFMAGSFTINGQNLNPDLEDDGSLNNITPDGVTITSRFSNKIYSTENSGMVTNNGLIFLVADDGVHGEELWVSDGTKEGTSMLMDILEGDSSSAPRNFTVSGDQVFFAATTIENGTELWVTDGTGGGTFLVKDIYEGGESGNPAVITAFKDGVVFSATDANSAQIGEGVPHMWYSDGSEEGTIKLSLDNENGVVPVTTGDADYISLIQTTDSLAFFYGSGGIYGNEMWVTNGVPEPWGTRILVDINDYQDTTEAAAPGATLGTTIQWIFQANDEQILFRANTPGHWIDSDLDYIGEELWVSDGSRKGTYPLGDYNTALDEENPNISQGTQFAYPEIHNGYVVFRADPGFPVRVEPGFTDLMPINGVEDGTGVELIGDLEKSDDNTALFGPLNSWTQPFFSYNDDLFLSTPFRADVNIFGSVNIGRELAVISDIVNFDETKIEIAANFDEDGGWSSPEWFTNVKGVIYFEASGPEADANEIYAFEPATRNAPVQNLVNWEGFERYHVYEVVNDADIDDENPHDLISFNDRLYFIDSQDQLWFYEDSREALTVDEPVAPARTSVQNDDLNEYPVASISAPTEGESFVGPEDITLSVDASDSDGSIARVEYYTYNGSLEGLSNNLIGTADSDPFDFEWTGVTAGEYTILALAYDNAEDSTYTLPVSITVVGNESPTITLTSPSDGATFTEGDPIGLGVNVSDVDGQIQYVKFYVNNNEVAEVTTEPYAFSFENAPVGTHEIFAETEDDKGAVATSSVVTITVEEEVVTGLNEKSGISIYPNPTDNNLYVDLNRSINGELSLVDILGKEVRSQTIRGSKSQINLNELSSGVYILKISTADEVISHRIQLK